MIFYLIVVPVVWVLISSGLAKGVEPQTRREWVQVGLGPLYALWIIAQAVRHSLKGF